MGFAGKAYKWLGALGAKILEAYPGLSTSIRRSGLHIHPEAYASLVAFATLVSLGASAALLAASLALRSVPGALAAVAIPTLTFYLALSYPRIYASNRASAVETEFPYTMSYLSTLVQSGMSPYVAFERVARAGGIFPHSANLSQRFSLLVRALGKDPLTAFSMLGERSPSPVVRETLMGYVTTVRAGGDVVDYLEKRARALFNDVLVRIKITADRLGGLLESYLAVILLVILTLAVMYFVTQSFAGVVPFGIGGGGLFLTLYVAMPLFSIAIIYVADLLQFKEPWMDWRPYIVGLGSVVPGTALLMFFGWLLYAALPPYHPLRQSPVVGGLNYAITWPARALGLPSYTYSSVALGMSLIYSTLPAAVYYIKVSREYKIVEGITRFIRDLVEVRKTGLSPERSIIELSKRPYGVFTSYLRRIALQLQLGIPLGKIVGDVLKKVRVWRARVLLFMLTDTIEVGGGTVEVLESLASFAESVEAIDTEKRRSLRTLMVVPYMGAVLSSMTVVLMAAYLGQLPVSVAAYEAAASQVLPSVVLNTYIMGIVAGKVASERAAAGFIHALVLTAAALAFFALAPLIGSAWFGMAGARS